MTLRTEHHAEWERLRGCADNFADQELFERWCLIGDVLRELHPREYAESYATLLEMFSGVPESGRVATVENWERVANGALTHDEDVRREFAALVIWQYLWIHQSGAVRVYQRRRIPA